MKDIKNLTVRAILAAVLCAFAPVAIPSGAVPITLATFIIYIISACTDISFSVPAVILYIALGACGVPVFSGFAGGFQIISGITGGYIIGYLPCAAVISLLCSRFGSKKAIFPLSMILGTLICYVVGTVWYILQTKSSVAAALSVCILPFLLGDIIKIASAACISVTLRPKLGKILK